MKRISAKVYKKINPLVYICRKGVKLNLLEIIEVNKLNKMSEKILLKKQDLNHFLLLNWNTFFIFYCLYLIINNQFSCLYHF